MALLEVQGLKAYYGQTQALHDVSFSLEEGGITTLLGANGAGKTTTLRALCQVVKTRGEVLSVVKRLAPHAVRSLLVLLGG